MSQNQLVPIEPTTYFFTRSKDVHEENGMQIITLFARLTRESMKTIGSKTVRKVESVWVDIEEVAMEQATEKMRSLPNCILRYNVSKEVFLGLFKASVECPKELHYVTPFSAFRKS
jgi:hypothetical protein